MDLIVAGGSARVIAPADGRVEEIYIYQNEHNGEATVHFDIWEGETNICPEHYFISAAQTGMLALVRAKYPGAELCYFQGLKLVCYQSGLFP